MQTQTDLFELNLTQLRAHALAAKGRLERFDARRASIEAEASKQDDPLVANFMRLQFASDEGERARWRTSMREVHDRRMRKATIDQSEHGETAVKHLVFDEMKFESDYENAQIRQTWQKDDDMLHCLPPVTAEEQQLIDTREQLIRAAKRNTTQSRTLKRSIEKLKQLAIDSASADVEATKSIEKRIDLSTVSAVWHMSSAARRTTLSRWRKEQQRLQRCRIAAVELRVQRAVLADAASRIAEYLIEHVQAAFGSDMVTAPMPRLEDVSIDVIRAAAGEIEPPSQREQQLNEWIERYEKIIRLSENEAAYAAATAVPRPQLNEP